MFAFVGLASPSISAHRSTTMLLKPDRLGPVEVGMSVSQAEAALKAKLRVDYPDANPEGVGCGFATRVDRRDAAIAYMVEDGKITRIDVDTPKKPSAYDHKIVSERGIGIGSTEIQIRRAYQKAAQFDPHPYAEGHYVTIEGPKFSVLFETEHGKVTTFRSGLNQSVQYIEGCL